MTYMFYTCTTAHIRDFCVNYTRAPSRSCKPLRLAYDSLRLASRLKPTSHGFYCGGISYGGLSLIIHTCWRRHLHCLFVIFSSWHFVDV